MHLTLISPRLAFQKGDFLGSGVPYWPLELATLAAYVREQGDSVSLIDQFGEQPDRLWDAGDHYLQGVSIGDMRWRAYLDTADAFILYAISYMSHHELLETVTWLRQTYPAKPIAVLENSQAVTAYSLQRVSAPFFEAGADILICGEPYGNWGAIKQRLMDPAANPAATPNVITRNTDVAPQRMIGTLSRYAVPAWDLISLEGYWGLPYSHGPKTARFLPILTSRGCPYPCDFCVIPETSGRRWHGNAPEDVVEEIIALRDRFGVRDFQVEDLNPTVQHQRWERISELLIERKANIRFYFVSGTKAETLHIDKIPLLAAAGCRYVSISPESGSVDLMRVIGKRFNQSHGLELVRACRRNGIRTQACFLVGHPSETEADFLQSQQYLRELVRAGLDEAAVFIVAPFAGSALFRSDAISMDADTVALPSFSPAGRQNYADLARRRQMLIRTFFLSKLTRGADLWLQGLRSLFGTPQTKMENLPRRIGYILRLTLRHKWRLS